MKLFSLFNQSVGSILSNPNKSYVADNESLISGGPGFSTAPDVSGMLYNEAANLLLDNGFQWSVFNIMTGNPDNDGIVDSYTVDGMVYLNVYKYDSSLEVFATVPNLIGMLDSDAISAITSAGFQFAGSSTTTTGANSGNNNKVQSQNPTAGSSVDINTPISFTKYHYAVQPNTVNGNISGLRWAWHGDNSGNYAMFIRGTVFAGTVGSTISVSGTNTGMDGNHTVVSITPDNSFDTGGTRIMITRDSAATGISSTVTGTWSLVS